MPRRGPPTQQCLSRSRDRLGVRPTGHHCPEEPAGERRRSLQRGRRSRALERLSAATHSCALEAAFSGAPCLSERGRRNQTRTSKRGPPDIGECTRANTHKRRAQPDKVRCGLTPSLWRPAPHAAEKCRASPRLPQHLFPSSAPARRQPCCSCELAV